METQQIDQLWQQAFPVLTDSQLALIRPFGEERQTAAGDVLFEVGDRVYSMVIVVSGKTRIIDRTDGGEARVLKESGPGEFHAELSLLTGQTVFVDCVVREAGRVLLVSPERTREAIRTIPEISDILVTAFAARRQVLMRSAAAKLTLIGPLGARTGLGMQEFADRNRIPHRWLEPEDPAAQALLAGHPVAGSGTVRAVIRGQRVLDDPTPLDLARALGLDLVVHQDGPADVLVVGTGPAGLAAAVYAASEGLVTVAVDDVAIGGQAGTSSRIENYLGFPTGISGGELAFRAEVQAIKFGARITVPRQAIALEPDNGCYAVQLDDGTSFLGRSVIIATGARYRRLDLPRQEEFEGAGIYYAATDLEARFCGGEEVVVVGAGNSAGQAAMFLSGTARKVHLLCRGPALAASMSRYLVSRLEVTSNVELHYATWVRELRGTDTLGGIVVENRAGETREIGACSIFVMIGADPCTGWLRGTLDLDEKGFIRTGHTPGAVSPYQTSLSGIFAVGDARSGSVKRVASAVGEGSVVVQAVHGFLESLG